MLRSLAMAAVLAVASGCGEDPARPGQGCETVTLPLAGNASAPVVVDVGLEVQEGNGIVVVATATDPQGFGNVQHVLQSVGVFPDQQCEGAPVVIQDDLAGVGVEETFGTVIDASASPLIYAAIAAAPDWPVELDFRDVDGNRTTGRVRARVIR